MRVHGPLPARHRGPRPGRADDGKTVVMASSPRRCCDGCKRTCRNGKGLRAAFVAAFVIDAHDQEVIGAHDREVIARTAAAVANAGVPRLRTYAR